MSLLSVKGVGKRYPAFTLEPISLELAKGRIMGLIGKNGAGKTTLMKSMLGLVPADQGETQMLGLPFALHERQCKQGIGVVLGEIDFYSHKKLRDISAVTRRFYDNWSQEAYERYMTIFQLDDGKRVKELSSGMRVKYMLALALSHHAKLFILDEPTSGLDPVSRDDLLGLFSQLVADGERSILFSTHITVFCKIGM